MKRRHYLLIIILLFALSMWGLISSLNDSLSKSKQSGQIINPTQPEVPAPAATTQATTPDIVLNSPEDGDYIDSPVSITGKAKGNWFFEGSFPIQLTTSDGKIVATGTAQATDNWMTTDYVPFTASINFSAPADSSNGYLILKKNNSSGDPQFDKSLAIKVQW